MCRLSAVAQPPRRSAEQAALALRRTRPQRVSIRDLRAIDVVPPVGSAIAAGACFPQPDLAHPRRIRRLLAEIEQLARSQAKGQKLSAAQQEKCKREPGLRAALAHIRQPLALESKWPCMEFD